MICLQLLFQCLDRDQSYHQHHLRLIKLSAAANICIQTEKYIQWKDFKSPIIHILSPMLQSHLKTEESNWQDEIGMSAIKYQMIPVFFADINNHKIVLRPPTQTTNGATLETVKYFMFQQLAVIQFIFEMTVRKM